MKSRKGALVIIFILLAMFVVSSLTIQNEIIKDLINTVIAIIGALAIWYQLKKEKDIAEGGFIVDLNNSFVENEGIKSIYSKLRNTCDDPTEDVFDSELDRQYIVDYLTYFETLYVLYEKGIFSIDEIDTMFAYRFFLAINDPRIQEIELKDNLFFYEGIYRLYVPWKAYRLKKGKEILKEEYCYEKFYQDQLKKSWCR